MQAQQVSKNDKPDQGTEQIIHELKRYLNIRTITSARFTSDGEHVAFLANITGVPQIWITYVEDRKNEEMSMDLLSVDTTERVSLSEITGDMFLSSKSNDLIAYGSDAGGNERHQIYVIEKLGERLKKITDEPEVVHCLGNFSHDGRRIGYSSNRREKTAFDLYVQDLDGAPNSGKMVYEGKETLYPIEWSPNDKTILFKSIHAPFNHDLSLLDLTSLKAEQVTSHDVAAIFDSPTFSKSGKEIYCITDVGREFSAVASINIRDRSISLLHTENNSDIDILRQSPDGRFLAFTTNMRGYSRLKILSLGKTKKHAKEISLPSNSIVLDLDWAPDSSKLCFVITSSTLNTDVWIYDIGKSKLQRITNISVSSLPRSSFVSDREITYKSFDGLKVSSYLYLPKSGKRTHPAPLLVLLHGGPESQFRPTFNPIVQYFLKQGIAVAVPNYRGSTGYGRTFAHLDDVRNRMNTVKDVEYFISALRERKEFDQRIDYGKIAAYGGSYGGFMVLGCLYANSDLWSAGVDIVGIANFVTFLENTGPWRRALRIPEYGDPVLDREFLLSISPTTNAHKIKAPLFVIHGTNDPRVPIEEAEQIVSTMQKLGREVHILKFEGEGHGLHKISDRIQAYSAAISFLLEHLKHA